MMEIKVLGTGCKKCNELEALVKNVLAESGLQANIEKVTDIPKIMSYGVMMTPALVVNGEVKASGRIPTKEEIRSWVN